MKKIFLLEDEEVLAKFYQNSFLKAGFSMKVAHSIKDAFVILKDFEADVLIIDHGLKGEKQMGVDILPEFKKLKPNSISIILSNYSHLELRQEAKNKGADAFFVKLNTPPRELVKYVANLFI